MMLSHPEKPLYGEIGIQTHNTHTQHLYICFASDAKIKYLHGKNMNE